MAAIRKRYGNAPERGRWLDVGCGSGVIASTLAADVREVVAADPEPWPDWESATARAANLEFVVAECDGEGVPWGEETFDVVICNQVYEHVRHPDILVKNIARALKPGGVCYFAGPNLLWPIEPHVFWPFVHWLPRRQAQRLMRALGSRRAGELDAYSTTYGQLVRWFSDSGLAYEVAIREKILIELEMRNWKVMTGLVSVVPTWLFRVFVPLSPGFVFYLRKLDDVRVG